MTVSQLPEQRQLVWTKWGIYVNLARAFPDLRTDAVMPKPFAPPLVLSTDERERLESLTRAHSSPQALVFRCRLILRLSRSDLPSNVQVANEFGCSRNTVILWRTRYLRQGLAGLQDAPRSGRPRSFSPQGATGSHHAGHQQNQRT